jgi:long-subunit acyl-CoA synthetase (AMP-forming)
MATTPKRFARPQAAPAQPSDGSKKFRTSGTTGAPKDVALTKAAWEARIAAHVATRPPGYAAIKSWYNETNKQQSGFQKQSEWAAKNGVTVYAPTGATIVDAITLWKANKIQGIVSGPAGLTNYALAKPGYKFAMLIATGSMLTPARSKMIRAELGENLFVTYAATETDTISFAAGADVEAFKGPGVLVGKPVPGVTVSIIAGEVCIKTPRLAPGIAVDAQGWYHTGDLGSLAADGSIILTGQRKS